MDSLRKIPLGKAALIIAAIAVIIGAALYLTAVPRHNRQWTEDLSVLPTVERHGDSVTLRHVRDWRYDADGPTVKQWIDRTIDTKDVEGVWFLVEPFEKWDGIAHTFLVFDIKDDEPLVVSVEARREVGEGFSPIMGALRKYELVYVLGTEQDLLTRRAVSEKNRLYMYPLSVDAVHRERLLDDLLATTEDIAGTPRFYDTLTGNCTNLLAKSANAVTPGSVPWDKSFIFPGYSAEYLRKLGFIRFQGSVEQLKERHRIDRIVKEIGSDEHFSQELRARISSNGQSGDISLTR